MSKSKNSIKTVAVEYIESGTFVGGEEDCYKAKINSDGNYLVIKERDYNNLQCAASKYTKILHILSNDESGDLGFVRCQVLKIVENKD